MAELVDASVSNTDGKPCRFDSGSGYHKKELTCMGWLFCFLNLLGLFISTNCVLSKLIYTNTQRPEWLICLPH